MDYESFVEAMNDYNSRSVEDIKTELRLITKSYTHGKMDELCKKAGVSKQTIYAINKENHPYRPSFEVYTKIMAAGEVPSKRFRKRTAAGYQRLSEAERKDYRKRYQHHYYVTVTKRKRTQEM